MGRTKKLHIMVSVHHEIPLYDLARAADHINCELIASPTQAGGLLLVPKKKTKLLFTQPELYPEPDTQQNDITM